MTTRIENKYGKDLPKEYLEFLADNPNGDEVTFNEFKNEDPDSEGRYWTLLGENELLESWEMKGVGRAANFECLKLYVAVQREHGQGDWTTSNIGKIELQRVEAGFVFGEENGDYLYFDPSDGYSVWIYYHGGGDVLRIADSFSDFNR